MRRYIAITFDTAKPATVETTFAGKTHILVRARVNGQDVGWFLLDSAAGAMVIDKAVADSLHRPLPGWKHRDRSVEIVHGGS
jgi:hypothetical protein